MRVKRDKRDAIFSLLIRERSSWLCERCGKQFSREDGQGLHCSHFISRRHRSTRWHPDNAAAHCFSCHQYLGEHPMEFTRWIEARLGQGRADIMMRYSQVVAKFSKKDLESIYRFMKNAHWDMLDERSRSPRSRLNFPPAPEISALAERIR